MSMRQTITNAVNSAFNAIGNLVEPITFKSVTGNTYDPVTGGVVLTSTNVNLKRTVFYSFEEKEADNTVVVGTDMKVVLPTADLGGIIPKSQDILVDSKSRTWEIVRLMSVPGDEVTLLHVRTSR